MSTVTDNNRDSARSHFVQVVLPAYAVFMEHYVGREFGFGADARNAESAAQAMLHLADKILLERGGYSNPTEYRRALFKRCEAYAIVSDVALAAKHGIVSRGEGFVKSSNALFEHIAVDRYVDRQGVYFRYRKLLEVMLPKDKAADFGRFLFQSVTFLARELSELQITPGMPSIAEPLPLFVDRSSIDRIRTFKSLGLVGEFESWGHKVFFYRPDMRRLTPMRAGEKMGASFEIQFNGETLRSPFERA